MAKPSWLKVSSCTAGWLLILSSTHLVRGRGRVRDRVRDRVGDRVMVGG